MTCIRFKNDDQLDNVVVGWFKSLLGKFSEDGIKKLLKLSQKKSTEETITINKVLNGNYIER